MNNRGRIHSDYDGYMYDILGHEIANRLIQEAHLVSPAEMKVNHWANMTSEQRSVEMRKRRKKGQVNPNLRRK